MDDRKYSPLCMEKPAIYRVTVRGRLDSQWCGGLEDLNRTEEELPGEGRNTIIVGRLADQATLSGLLNSLYELHLPIVSVECLEAED